MRISAICMVALALLPGAAAADFMPPRVVQLATTDIVYDPATRMLYASVGGNTITAVDPFTGAVGGSAFVGNGLGPSALELLPGLHWQVNETWWISSGVSVPLRATTRAESGLWQLTWSWRF